MKKILVIIAALTLTSCESIPDMDSVKDKMKNLGKNPCYDKIKKVVVIGCNPNDINK